MNKKTQSIEKWERKFIREQFMSEAGLDFMNKETMLDYLISLFMSKTNLIFDYEGFDDTVSRRDMELLIQTRGYAIHVRHQDNDFMLRGTLGGVHDYNFMPTRAIISEPYLDLFENCRIYYGRSYDISPVYSSELKDLNDCVVYPNDTLYTPLYALCKMYAQRLTETYLSRKIVTINSRYINVFSVEDQNALQAIEDFYKKVVNGELTGILDKNRILEIEGIRVLPLAGNSSSSRMITELIEAEQYDKASFYNEIGLQANYNMKREAINSNESQLNRDTLYPYIQCMLESRQKACERSSKIFGREYSVKFNAIWETVVRELEASLEMLEKQAQNADMQSTTVNGADVPNDDKKNNEEQSTTVNNEEGEQVKNGEENNEIQTDGEKSGSSESETAEEKSENKEEVSNDEKTDESDESGDVDSGDKKRKRDDEDT